MGTGWFWNPYPVLFFQYDCHGYFFGRQNLARIANRKRFDLNQKIPVTSNDEIGDLVVAFNKIRERNLEYDKLKTEFMANISHELRTPLNVILATIQLFELYAKGDPVKNAQKAGKNIKTMKQNCMRLTRLVNNVEFSDINL